MIFSRRRDPSSGIRDFWAAWPALRARAEAAFAAQRVDHDLVHDVSERVNAIHADLEWEFSKGRTAQHAFIVSAAGDPALRALAHRWQLAAPAADATWEYHGARQAEPAMLDGAFEADGVRAELSELRYGFALDEPRHEYDVVVYHPAFVTMPEQDRLRLAYLSLTWLLGEDGVEIWIGTIDTTVAELDGALPGSALAEAVAALAGQFDEDSWAVLSTPETAAVPRFATVQQPLKPARRPSYDTHIGVTLPFRATGNGLPDQDSLDALRAFEDSLAPLLDGAELIAHETGENVRTLHIYGDSTRFAAKPLEKHAGSWREGRAKVRTSTDPSWERVRHLRP